VARKVILAKIIFDGTGGPLIHNGAILIQDDRILNVGPASMVTIPADAERVSLPNCFVLPGIVNAHGHLGRVSPDSTSRVLTETTPAEMIILAIKHARQQLMGGTTTIRILGELDFIDIYYKRAIDADFIPGPRALVSGPHLKATHQPGPIGQPVDGPDEMRRAVRAHLAAGVDVIKLMVTGDLFDRPTHCFFTQEEIQVAVDEAHAYGARVAAHLMGGYGLDYALRAGVDTLEHGRFFTEQEIERVLEAGVILVTNLQYIFGERVRSIYPSAREIGIRSVQLPYHAGVKMAIGNDSWNAIYSMAREIELLVNAGVSEHDALLIATRNGAEACGLQDQIGTLESGKLADLVAVAGNPLDRIEDLRKVEFVMKGGKTYNLSLL